MADIQQAVRWMKAGHTVKRSSTDKFWCSAWEPARISYDVSCADGGEHQLDFFDLLADDWEITP